MMTEDEMRREVLKMMDNIPFPESPHTLNTAVAVIAELQAKNRRLLNRVLELEAELERRVTCI